MRDSVKVNTVGFEPATLGSNPSPAIMVPCPNGEVGACKALQASSILAGIFRPAA